MKSTAVPSPVMVKVPTASRACVVEAVSTIADAARLPPRNPMLAFLVFHLVFLPYALLVFLHSLFSSPLLERIEDSPSLDMNIMRELAARESVFFFLFSAVSFIGMMLVVRGSDLVYAGIDEELGIRGLLTRVWSPWRIPLVAWTLVSVLVSTIVCGIMYLATVQLVKGVNIWWSCLAMAFAAVSYLWLVAIGNLFLVVSVLEDRIGNLKSVATRSWKLMRGKWKEGFWIMLVLETMSIPIYVVFSVTTTDDDDTLRLVTRLGFGYAATALFCIARFFSFVVFTVFYHGCRKCHGEKLGTELVLGRCYNAVIPDDSDLSIP
ncbi:hypothetical protein MLD38_005326 [Melastoma candidum]|uniref:Uncharacterized protein n=1 Tax=Melastoma candidum TaxID=119954 RepID=A0ACB9SDC5_9MYRT|nr:hypothetical protein MLD38_005326 [Melastoma candidum]